MFVNQSRRHMPDCIKWYNSTTDLMIHVTILTKIKYTALGKFKKKHFSHVLILYIAYRYQFFKYCIVIHFWAIFKDKLIKTHLQGVMSLTSEIKTHLKITAKCLTIILLYHHLLCTPLVFIVHGYHVELPKRYLYTVPIFYIQRRQGN